MLRQDGSLPSADLIGSLFCGLVWQERLAVFVSAADETVDRAGTFSFGGYVAPELDWANWFAPAWNERVLDGPPRIAHLHMTDIRSKQWRADNGITRLQAERRVDEAVRVITSMGSLYPVTSSVSVSDFRTLISAPLLRTPSYRMAVESPDYMCFMAYAITVLHYAPLYFGNVDKIHFVLERNGKVTKHIEYFHGQIAEILAGAGWPHLVPLVGDLIPAGKDRVPLQASDVLCWHLQRAYAHDADDTDSARLIKLIGRPGQRHEWTTTDLVELSERFQSRGKRSDA